MTVRNFTLRISGNVALADNTIKSFLNNYDSAVKGSLVDSNLAFRSLYSALKSQLISLEPWTNGNYAVTPSADPTASAVAAEAAAIVITGIVAYEDNSIKSFAFELRDDGSAYNHTGAEGIAAWEDIADEFNDAVADMFEELYTANGNVITVTVA